MKIGLFTDSHYCDRERTCTTRRPSLSYEKIREAMTVFAAAKVDLVLCLGDLVDDCGSREKNVEKLGELTSLIASFGLPFYSLMGNHDYQNFTREEFDTLTGGAYPPFSRRYGKAVLIFLDANYKKDGTVYEPGKVDWVDTKLPGDQVNLLRQALDDSAGQSVYVFTHQNPDDTVEEHHVIANAGELRRMFEEAGNVKAVLSGHYHPGHDSEIGGIRYHTLPAMCEGEENRYKIFEIEN